MSDLAARSDMWLNQQGRLTEPMIKRPGSDHYEPIGWNDALGVLAQELKGLDSPDEAVFYTSGRPSNEAAFVFQLFARALGTNNLPDCSNMCHESSGFALNETLGVGKGGCTYAGMTKQSLRGPWVKRVLRCPVSRTSQMKSPLDLHLIDAPRWEKCFTRDSGTPAGVLGTRNQAVRRASEPPS